MPIFQKIKNYVVANPKKCFVAGIGVAAVSGMLAEPYVFVNGPEEPTDVTIRAGSATVVSGDVDVQATNVNITSENVTLRSQEPEVASSRPEPTRTPPVDLTNASQRYKEVMMHTHQGDDLYTENGVQEVLADIAGVPFYLHSSELVRTNLGNWEDGYVRVHGYFLKGSGPKTSTTYLIDELKEIAKDGLLGEASEDLKQVDFVVKASDFKKLVKRQEEYTGERLGSNEKDKDSGNYEAIGKGTICVLRTSPTGKKMKWVTNKDGELEPAVGYRFRMLNQGNIPALELPDDSFITFIDCADSDELVERFGSYGKAQEKAVDRVGEILEDERGVSYSAVEVEGEVNKKPPKYSGELGELLQRHRELVDEIARYGGVKALERANGYEGRIFDSAARLIDKTLEEGRKEMKKTINSD